MNLHDSEFDPRLQELEAKLSHWKVAPPAIDPKVVFYQAGFAAANAQNQTRVWNRRLVTAASLLLAIGFSCMISYRAGQSSVIGEMNQIASKTPSLPEQSDAPSSELTKDSNSTDLARATGSNADAPTTAPTQSLIMKLCSQWLQNTLPLNNSHDRDLLAATDPSRQLDRRVSQRDSVNTSMPEPVDLNELVDSPEYAMLKRERALRSQRLINWLPTL